MRRLLLGLAVALFAAGDASAHPASGIVVAANGDVYFIHTGKGVCKIDKDGKLSYVHQVTGGGHFLAIDNAGSFADAANNRLFVRITPKGEKPALLYASGGAPLVVHRDGKLYYGSGFPGGDDLLPGGLTLSRMMPDGKRELANPGLKASLARLNQAVTGLAAGPEGALFIACPNAIFKFAADGTLSPIAHPIHVQDCSKYLPGEANSPFFHAPYLRGLAVAPDGTAYAAVTGCRCVIQVSPEGRVKTVLKSEPPWAPTGVAVHEGDVFVLEYSNANESPEKGWRPRVRKLSRDGKIATLATIGEAK